MMNLLFIACGINCDFAKKVWKFSFLNGVYKSWKEPNFITLFEHVAGTSSNDELLLFGVIAWLLWKNRNARRHGEFIEEGARVIWSAKGWLSSYQSAHVSSPSSSVRPTQIHENEVWLCPSSTYVKLNADAACDFNARKAGVGFVLRNDVGNFIGAGSIPIPGNPSVLALEGLAVLHGLQFCLDDGWRRVEVESDAANVISALNSMEVDFSMEGCIFDDIKGLISEFEVIKWRKIPRSCNRVAHLIARKSLSFVEKRFWKEIGHPWLEEGVLADINN